MRKCFMLFTLLVFASLNHAAGQPVQFKVALPLTIGSVHDTLYVGVRGDGPGGTINDNTYGLDETGFGPLGSWGESSAPPADPDGNRIRFVDIPGRTEITTGGYLYPCDFRGFTSLSQVDTFSVRIDGARVEASGVTVQWPATGLNKYGVSWKLYSRSGSVFTEVANMMSSTSYVFSTTGGSIQFAIIKTGVLTTGVDRVDYTIPSKFHLEQSYPNPFNPSTIINYQVSAASSISLKVFDVLGREVVTLVNERQSPGRYSATFDASHLSSGIYFYELRTNGAVVAVKKMALMK